MSYEDWYDNYADADARRREDEQTEGMIETREAND